jgi:hypothetical protein
MICLSGPVTKIKAQNLIDWSNSISKGIGTDKLKTVVQTMRNMGD